MSPRRPARKPSKRRIESAYHEAGHALVAAYYGVPIHSLSIARRGRSGGRVLFGTHGLGCYMPASVLKAINYAGVAAEAILGDRPVSVSDIYNSGLTDFAPDEWTADTVTSPLMQQVREFLGSHRPVLRRVAEALLDSETLSSTASRRSLRPTNTIPPRD